MDHNWEDMAVQVINLCGTTFSKSQIIKDLKFTKSAESTVNRIFDGLFLCDVGNGHNNVDNLHNNVENEHPISSSSEEVAIHRNSKPKHHSQKQILLPSNIDIVTIDSSVKSSENQKSSDSSCQIINVKPINLKTSKKEPLKSKKHNYHLDLDLSDELDLKMTYSSNIRSEFRSESTRQLVLDFDDDDDLSFLNKPVSPVGTSQIMFPEIYRSEKSKKSCSAGRSQPKNVLQAREKVECISEKNRQRLEEKARKSALAEKALHEKKEKSQIKAVNTLKQKVNCAEELLIHMCSIWSLEEKSKVIVQSLSEAGAIVVSQPLQIPYTMSFIRKVERLFDFEREMWTPCDRKLEAEPYVLFLISSSRLIDIFLQQNTNGGLLSLFKKCSETYPDYTIIWILEDLQEYYRKMNSARAKKENDELRGYLGQSVKKRKKNELDVDNLPDRKEIEEELLRIQVAGGTKIRIHPCSSSETAGWIVSFVQQIAFFPEQYVRSSISLGLNFGDSVKSGKGAKETWKKMLEQIPGVSENVSNAIINVYPICADFIKQISSKSTAEAAALLMGIPVTINGKSKAIGKITATRIVAVMMGNGP